MQKEKEYREKEKERKVQKEREDRERARKSQENVLPEESTGLRPPIASNVVGSGGKALGRNPNTYGPEIGKPNVTNNQPRKPEAYISQ